METVGGAETKPSVSIQPQMTGTEKNPLLQEINEFFSVTFTYFLLYLFAPLIKSLKKKKITEPLKKFFFPLKKNQTSKITKGKLAEN